MSGGAGTRCLGDLIEAAGGALVEGSPDTIISDITLDSRKAGPGSLFVAIPGSVCDGHSFVSSAVEAGASAVLAERRVETGGAALAIVESTSRAASPLAAEFFSHPSRELDVIGITGTNGKTTTAFLLRRILDAEGIRTGLIGTINYLAGDEEWAAPNTTPDAILLQRLLREMINKGMTHVVMEISSHALALGRTDHLSLRGAVFTNLTQDHLDFHADMEEYFAKKRAIFDLVRDRDGLFGAAGIDDPYGRRLRDEFRKEGVEGIIGFGLSPDADIRAENLSLGFDGSSFEVVFQGLSLGAPDRAAPGSLERSLSWSLIGRPNLLNALAALSAARIVGIDPSEAVRALCGAGPVRGRFEKVYAEDFGVVVDYAHTPDAIENLIKAGRALGPKRLILLFGCGGDRDRKKRPLMGRIASRGADLVYVTSDNPRTEDAASIIDEIETGKNGSGAEWVRIEDRRSAIREAIGAAREGDLILIAGKGHEDYQIIGREKIHFDDAEEAVSALAEEGRL